MYSMRLYDEKRKKACRGLRGPFLHWNWGDGYGNGRKRMGEGRRTEIPVSEAFRCHGANLLPVTKFIGNGLFIKYLGQVDLPGAPPNIAPTQLSPPVLSHTSPSPFYPPFSKHGHCEPCPFCDIIEGKRIC